MGKWRKTIEGLFPVTKRYTKRRLDEIENKIKWIDRKVEHLDNNLTGRIFEQLPDYTVGLNFPQRRTKIIVSVTSYSPRIQFVAPCLYSLLHQTYKPDLVFLWLSEGDFPLHEESLPQEILKLKEIGLSICWCEDIKPHKKYYEVMRQFPEDIVITADDDVIYPAKTIELLYKEYQKDATNVYATRVREIKMDKDTFLPYEKWPLYSGRCEKGPSLKLVPTGVGGVLYPPHSMDNELFDKGKIRELCLNTDDLWLKSMQLKKSTKVKKIYWPFDSINFVEGSQENALWENNVCVENDACINRLKDYFQRKSMEEYNNIIERIKSETT